MKIITCFSAITFISFFVSSSDATTIHFHNAPYSVVHVDLTSPGCVGDFGKKLNNDIQKDPVKILISIQYDTQTGQGGGFVKVLNNANSFEHSLFPLGILGIYRFGSWFSPTIMHINHNDYYVMMVTYETKGKNEEEWIKNGQGTIGFRVSDKAAYLCGATTSPPRPLLASESSTPQIQEEGQSLHKKNKFTL